jgi:hypothetical protein
MFQRLTPVASASTTADKLLKALNEVESIVGADGKVELSFAENSLTLRGSGANGNVTSILEASIVSASKEKYYYTLKNFISHISLLKGSVTMSFTKDMIIEIKSTNTRFLQVGIKPDAIIKSNTEPRIDAA